MMDELFFPEFLEGRDETAPLWVGNHLLPPRIAALAQAGIAFLEALDTYQVTVDPPTAVHPSA